MVLVIDNYDSFTYNLVQYLGELGATMVVRRNDEASLDQLRALGHDRVVISPGPGRPDVRRHALEPAAHDSPGNEAIAARGADWVGRWTTVVLK